MTVSGQGIENLDNKAPKRKTDPEPFNEIITRLSSPPSTKDDSKSTLLDDQKTQDPLDTSSGKEVKRILDEFVLLTGKETVNDKNIKSTISGNDGTDQKPLDGKQKIAKAIEDLGSKDFKTRESAMKSLASAGEAALPQISEALKKTDDPDVKKRLTELLDYGVDKKLTLPGQGLNLDRTQKLMPGDLDGIDKELKQIDELASDPKRRQALAEEIRQLPKTLGMKIDQQLINDKVLEIQNIGSTGTLIRAEVAQNLSQNGQQELAQKYLIDAMKTDKGAVENGKFLKALVATGASKDDAFKKEFEKAGGDIKLLERLTQMSEKTDPSKSTTELWQNFGIKLDNVQQMAPHERLAKYMELKNQPGKEQERIQLLAEHYHTATTDRQKQQALDLLNKESEEGKKLAVLLPILSYAQATDGSLPHGQQKPRFDNPIERIVEIEKQMKQKPSERTNPNDVPNLLVEHYRQAKTDQQRDEALKLLKKEVLAGNQSAQFTLNGLTRLDASLKLADATAEIQKGDPKLDVKKANERIDKAVKELATLDHFDEVREKGRPANSLDYLTRRPKSGDNTESKKPATGSDSLTKTQELVATTLVKNHGDREKTIKQLEEGAEKNKGDRGEEYKAAAKLAKTLFTSMDAKYGLGDDAGAKALLELGKQANEQSNGESKALLERLKKNGGEQGPALVEAILKQNGAKVTELLENDPNLVKVVGKELDSLTTDFEAKSTRTGFDAIRGFGLENKQSGLEDKYKQFRKEAEQFDKTTVQQGEDAVTKYLARDTPGDTARKEILGALPKNGSFQLDKDDPLRQVLTEATATNVFTPKADRLTNKLLTDKLSEQEVKELKDELNLIGDARRKSALKELEQAADSRLPYACFDLENTVRTLQSIDSCKDVHRASKEALKALENSDFKNSGQALKQVVTNLKEMEKLATGDHQHPLSTEFYKQFGGKEQFDKLYKALENGTEDPIEAKKALNKILKEMPDGEDKANQFRTLRIVSQLEPGSTPESFQKISAVLTREIEASKLESSTPNKYAADWLQWSQAQEQIATLSKASSDNNKVGAKSAVDLLIKQATDGNTYSKTALAAVIAGDTNHIAEFLRSYPGANEKPTYVPNLKGLDAESRKEITKQTLTGLGKVVEADRVRHKTQFGDQSQPEQLFSAQEICAIGLGVSKLKDNGKVAKEDETLEKQYEILLSKATTDVGEKARGEVMKGLLDAMNCDKHATRSLSDYYAKDLNHPALAEQFNTLEIMARDGNEGAMRVLAAISAGHADFNRNDKFNPRKAIEKNGEPVLQEFDPVSTKARKILEATADTSPAARKNVVEALLHVQKQGADNVWNGDNKELLATLGTVARGLDNSKENEPLRKAAMEEIRDSFVKYSNKLEKEKFANPEDIDRRDKVRYQSAFDGMVAMAPHWTAEDGLAFTKHLTPEVLTALKEVGKQISPDAAKGILNRVEERVRELINPELKDVKDLSEDPVKQLSDNLKVMAALGQHATIDQVDLLASLGGDEKWNTSTKSGKEILKERFPDLSDDGVLNIQSDAGRALLNILARAQNDPIGESGPRQRAYEAFKDLPWPIRTPDGKTWMESQKSAELRTTLADYYKGNPLDLNMAREISRIVDDMHLPIPPAALLAELNIGSLDLEDIGSGQTVWELADKIVANYSKNGENGEEVLRRVLANIELANSLPGEERAKLMGWGKQPTELGWFDQPPKELYRHLGFMSLSEKEQADIRKLPEPERLSKERIARLEALGKDVWTNLSDQDRDDLRWSTVQKINVIQVLGQMHGDKLQNKDGLNSALLDKNLFNVAEGLKANHTTAAKEAGDTAKSRKSQFDGLFAKLIDTTKEGASFVNQSIGLFTGDNGRDMALVQSQKSFLSILDIHSKRQGEATKLQASEEKKANEIQVALEIAKHKQLVDKGEQLEADKLALKLWKEHGPALAIFAPKVWESLNVSADDTLQGASSLKRLHARGLSHFDAAPGYEKGKTGFRAALGLENALDQKDKRGLIQLKNDDRLLDKAALREHMMKRIEQDPVLLKLSESSRNMSQALDELGKMVDAGSKGEKYEDFAAAAKKRAEIVEKEMDKITPDDLHVLKDRIKDMEEAVDKISDETAKNELKSLIKTYKGMHNMFNLGNPEYPEEAPKDEGGKVRNTHKETREMIKMLKEGGFTADTFSNWFKENGPVIAATIVAIAATVAACATLGITSPIAVGACVALAGLVAREVTNETLYHINKNGYTGVGAYGQYGSALGNWAREWDNRTEDERVEALFKDVVIPYGCDFLRDWAAFVVTAGLCNYLFGPTEAASMQALSATERAQLAQLAQTSRAVSSVATKAPNAASETFFKTFLTTFGKELATNAGFTAVQTTIETGAQKAIGKQNMLKMGEWGQFGMSFALSTGLAMLAGARHHFKSAEMKSGNVMHFQLEPGATREQVVNHYKEQGYQVKEVKPGRFEVLPFNAKPGTTPMIMQEVDSAGNPVTQKEATGAKQPLSDKSQPPSKPAHVDNVLTGEQSKLKGILDKASFPEGSDGERLRLRYEESVRNGKLTPEQAKRIIESEKTTRAQAEKALGRLTGEALDKFLGWNPEQRTALLEQRPNIFEAVNKGLMDGADVASYAKMLKNMPGHERVLADLMISKMLRSETQFTPKAFKESLALLEPMSKLGVPGMGQLSEIFADPSVPREAIAKLVDEKSPASIERIRRLADIHSRFKDGGLINDLAGIKDPNLQTLTEKALLQGKMHPTLAKEVSKISERLDKLSAESRRGVEELLKGARDLNPIALEQKVSLGEAHDALTHAKENNSIDGAMESALKEILSASDAGPNLVKRFLQLPPEFRNCDKLTDVIKRKGTPAEIREPLRRAEVEHGVSKLDQALQQPLRDLLLNPDGVTTVQRILNLPPELLAEFIKPELANGGKQLLAQLRAAEDHLFKVIDAERWGNRRPPTGEEVLGPERYAKYKEIWDQTNKNRLELSKAEIESYADAYLNVKSGGNKNFEKSLPPDGQPVKKEKIFHIVLGLPGAGKSGSMVTPLQKEYGARLIDADFIKPELPGYDNGLGNQYVHHRSIDVANQIRAKAFANGDNVVQSVCGVNVEGVETMIAEARKHGYQVAIHLADVAPEVSVNRIYDRGYAVKSPDGVNQLIGIDYPLAVGHRPRILFDHLTSMPGYVDAWRGLDTNKFPGKPTGQSVYQIPTKKP